MKRDQLAIMSSWAEEKQTNISAGQIRNVHAIIMTVVCKLLQIYKLSTFIITMLDAFYQSLVCFFVPYLVSTGVIHILSLQSSVKNKKKKKKKSYLLKSQGSSQSTCLFSRHTRILTSMCFPLETPSILFPSWPSSCTRL